MENINKVKTKSIVSGQRQRENMTSFLEEETEIE